MINLPQQNFIIFQLLSFPKGKPSEIREERVVSLEVIPTMIEYRLLSRDAVYQTHSSIFVDKFPVAPIQCTLSGNFGKVPRTTSLKLLDGFGRLKEMELLFRQSKSTQDDKIFLDYLQQQGVTLKNSAQDELDKTPRVYVMNYYDFIFQEFFAVNLNSMRWYGNARQNTQVQFYDLQFIGVGEQYQAPTDDFLLDFLKSTRKAFLAVSKSIQSELDALQASKYIQGVSSLLTGLSAAADIASGIDEIFQVYSKGVPSRFVTESPIATL